MEREKDHSILITLDDHSDVRVVIPSPSSSLTVKSLIQQICKLKRLQSHSQEIFEVNEEEICLITEHLRKRSDWNEEKYEGKENERKLEQKTYLNESKIDLNDPSLVGLKMIGFQQQKDRLKDKMKKIQVFNEMMILFSNEISKVTTER